MGGESLATYILMQRIHPPVVHATLVRHGHARDEDTVSELGVYGSFVKVGDEVSVNECTGHLLRTKPVTSDEGGVFAGFAVLDSPYLVAADSS
jgi:glutathione synthase